MTAMETANFMIYILSDAIDDLTNDKLNLLLYLAQGHYLAKYGIPLFEDPIVAGKHGPIVPTVYSLYRKYENVSISAYDAEHAANIIPETEESLFNVARKYGSYPLKDLRNMICSTGAPWNRVYQAKGNYTEIPYQMLLEYFSDLDELRPAVKDFKDDDFIGYRDENGILVLPKEWDD